MTVRSMGFIGGGRVVSILLGGLARARALPETIVVYDTSPDALAKLKAAHGQIAQANDAASAASQEIVFLAVHPPVLAEAAAAAHGALSPRATVVSLAPKVSITRLCQMLGGFGRVARMIPNAPSIVGRGYNPLAFGESFGPAEKQELLRLFSCMGQCPVVDEALLEAYAIITAMGPTYLWPQLYQLKALAESFGLSPQAAAEGVTGMLSGTLATMEQSGLSAEQVLDLIPVKPLSEEVETLVAAYRTKLSALMSKLRA